MTAKAAKVIDIYVNIYELVIVAAGGVLAFDTVFSFLLELAGLFQIPE